MFFCPGHCPKSHFLLLIYYLINTKITLWTFIGRNSGVVHILFINQMLCKSTRVKKIVNLIFLNQHEKYTGNFLIFQMIFKKIKMFFKIWLPEISRYSI